MQTLVELQKPRRCGRFIAACLGACLGVFFAGCAGPEVPQTKAERYALLPGKLGPSGEVVMVVSKPMWDRGIGGVVDSLFANPVRVLPQFEPRFDVLRLDPEEFDRFWKPHRNLVIFDIADRIDTQEPSLTVYRNRFAKGQIYAEVKAKNVAGAMEALNGPEGGLMLADMLEAEEAKQAVPRVASTPLLAAAISPKTKTPHMALTMPGPEVISGKATATERDAPATNQLGWAPAHRSPEGGPWRRTRGDRPGAER